MALRVVLLGLTGLGNTVLSGLGPAVVAVFTETYAGPYPYYPEVQLSALAQELGIPSHENVRLRSPEGVELLRSYDPDLVVVATFKQILPVEVLAIPRLGSVNFHPSLLPRYRGPSPTKAALLGGERESGVTICHMIEEVDAGRMIAQDTLEIGPTDDDGILRRKIAGLAGRMAPDMLHLYADGARPEGKEQDHSLATWAARPDDALALLEQSPDAEEMGRRFRALNPDPGVTVPVDGERRRVREIATQPTPGAFEIHGHYLVLEPAANR